MNATVANNLRVFFTNAYTMEIEAAERYKEIAEMLEVHHNQEVADIFYKLSGYGEQHAAEIAGLMTDMQEAVIDPWAFDWQSDEAPEVADLSQVHYLMLPQEALKLARQTEVMARDFYARVADQAEDKDVRRYAQEFAEEEAEHVGYVDNWLAQYPAPETAREDDDPPHMPE